MQWKSDGTAWSGDTVLDWTRQWQEAGRRRGGAELLLRQAERKFGPLGTHDRLRIELAPQERLLDWGERLVMARCLDEVFRW
ncbi:MAG TPA: hypothetical protein DD490_33335 [Acidobacteria bacterium]|nr:hypothetical protein [Acidobacteriota bacterium]